MTVKITYATMSADNEELNQSLRRGGRPGRKTLGQGHPFVVNGEERWGEGLYEERSPIDSEIVDRQLRPGAPKPTSTTRLPPPRRTFPDLGPNPLAGAGRPHAQGRRCHGGAAV